MAIRVRYWLRLLAAAAAWGQAAAASLPTYRDPAAAISARVDDLLKRMTLAEKLAQMSGAWFRDVRLLQRPGDWNDVFRATFSQGIGTVGPMRNAPLEADVAFRNAQQRYLIERTRLGIPALFHDEGAHGLVKPAATSFPVPIGLASSWDPELVEAVFDLVGRQMRSRGGQWALAPVVDVNREPRWGRSDETLGEDPYLTSRMGAAMVAGLQGGWDGRIDQNHVMATLKHYVGHGSPEGGLNRSPSTATPRRLRSVDLVPFGYIVAHARPACVMPSYNEIDGVPSHANRRLLQEVLRRELGFRGLIASDYEAIRLLDEGHHIAGSLAQAGLIALQAGVQMELPTGVCYPLLSSAVPPGQLPQAEIDAAVSEILAEKFRLGLFEHPYADAAAARSEVERPLARTLARRAALESIVLLKNNGILPLRAVKTIAVIGPNAAVLHLGGYSGVPVHQVSLLEGLRARAPLGTRIDYLPGCVLVKNDTDDSYGNWHDAHPVLASAEENRSRIAEAAALAERSDVVILAVGENEAISREAWATDHLGDTDTLELPGAQPDLVSAVLNAGKPVIAFVTNGRPLAIRELKSRAAAVLEAWYAGEETGAAAAALLWGDESPSGKLPISIPRNVGQLPDYYSKKPYAGPFGYEFTSTGPLWAFGEGLTYTRFHLEHARLQKQSVPAGGSTMASVDVVNVGDRPGTETVQMYLHQEVSSVTRAVRELSGFVRVFLRPGESRTVSLPVTPATLAIWGSDERWVVEPGLYHITLGSDSTSGEVLDLTITGQARSLAANPR